MLMILFVRFLWCFWASRGGMARIKVPCCFCVYIPFTRIVSGGRMEGEKEVSGGLMAVNMYVVPVLNTKFRTPLSPHGTVHANRIFFYLKL